MRRTLPLVALVPWLAATGPTTAPVDPVARGRQFAQWFLDGNGAAMAAAASPALRAALGPPDPAAPLRDQLLGPGPATPPPAGPAEQVTTVVVRTVVTHDGRSMRLTTTVDADGRVIGFLVRPDPSTEAPSTFLDYQTKAAARLPFDGTWTVAWGGRTVRQNYHAAYPDQRFAYDILIERDGRTHTGDGSRLADFYCYGQPILAPAAGKVVEAVNDLPDNVPGHMDPAHAAGNHVVLDLGGGEYAFLCHLKPGSLKVRAGDAVVAGQLIGMCGNSGEHERAAPARPPADDADVRARGRGCRSSSSGTRPTATPCRGGSRPGASRCGRARARRNERPRGPHL